MGSLKEHLKKERFRYGPTIYERWIYSFPCLLVPERAHLQRNGTVFRTGFDNARLVGCERVLFELHYGIPHTPSIPLVTATIKCQLIEGVWEIVGSGIADKVKIAN
jgi:hypothetical protein